MKKFICGFLVGAILCTFIGVFAATYVAETVSFKIFVDGKEFKSEKPALAIDGSTYLPLKAVGDALGVPVIWNNEKRQVEVGESPISNTSNISFLSFEKALKDSGVTYEKINKAANMIGAEEGYGYKTEKETIEVYKFNPSSDAYTKAKETNKIFLSVFDMTFDVVFNGEYCIISNTPEIINLFKTL